ncbi:MAG: PH domain-containing protein [Syntrophomonadaceae bacterium]|nr:PH domain-containing protein [Syntrophomonadaceae bacterium]
MSGIALIGLVIGSLGLLWLIAYLFLPRRYEVSDRGIVIRTPVSSHIIPKREIKSVDMVGKVKAGAGLTWQGGLFGYAGLFALADGSTARVYATSWERMVRVQTTGGDPYLLSPAEPEAFQECCRKITGGTSN